jgi:hypothetical protein
VDGNGLSFTCDEVTAIDSTPDADPKHWQEKCRAGWARTCATGDYSNLRIFGFQTDSQNTELGKVPQCGSDLVRIDQASIDLQAFLLQCPGDSNFAPLNKNVSDLAQG